MNDSHRFLVSIEQDEDGIYVATAPALRGRHTQARTLEELIPRMCEAIEPCLEVEELDEFDEPPIVPGAGRFCLRSNPAH